MPKLITTIKVKNQKKGYSQFVIEPLENGFGHTLGNALRRILLSFLPGASVVQVKIDGVPHEFSTIPGVTEDTVELILNLKKVHFRMDIKKPTVVILTATGPGDIKAGDLTCPAGIEVVNKDQHLVTLANKKTKLEMEVLVEYGRGYRLPQTGTGVGVLSVDSNFSPVTRVNYKVESTRVGRLTNLDKLVLDIFTTGTISPKEALQQAAAILVERFSLLTGNVEVEKLPEEERVSEVKKKPEEDKLVYLEEINLPTRIVNIFKKSGYETLQDLQGKDEKELKQIKNVGPKTISLILEKMEKLES